MPQAIPLRAALRVEAPGVVVHDAGFLLVDVLDECLTAKEGSLGLEVQRCVESDTDTGFDFGLGGGRR